MSKTRDEVLAKVASLSAAFSGSNGGDDGFFDDSYGDGEPTVMDEVQEILTTIAGNDEGSMLSEEDIADLLRSRDIYHFQSEAVRFVRQFLAA